MADQSDNDTTTENQSDDLFGESDLGRIQGILLGDHAKRTAERIDTLERALLGAISDLKSDLSAAVTDLGKRIDTEETNRTTGLANLSERLKTSTTSTSADLKVLRTSLEKTEEALIAKMDESSGDHRVELDALRRDLAAEIESTEASLSNRKVDRQQLANLMAKLAGELSD